MLRSVRTIPALVIGILLSFHLTGGCDIQRGSPPQVEGEDTPLFANSLGMEFRRIPSGTFRMGSALGEDDERPVHTVKITDPFLLGAHEVTQAQWNILMDENPSHLLGPQRPVDSVTWHHARRFINRLNEKENTELYRLPTEAEWEYAVRGGTTTRFYFGESKKSLSDHAWYGLNSDEQSHRVGQKRSNPFELHDVYGNVWEWTRDAYGSAFYERSERANPVNKGGWDARRVIRGGGWFEVATTLRSANRGWARPDAGDPQLGFRVVREIPRKK